MDFKDSGTRRDFGTGAVRDMASDKGRFDLLPFDAIQELARVYDKGAKKYSSRNWEQGIPVWAFMDSAARHLMKAIAGETDEPHLPMAMWNVACAIQMTKWVYDGARPADLAYDKPVAFNYRVYNPLELTDTVSVDFCDGPEQFTDTMSVNVVVDGGEA